MTPPNTTTSEFLERLALSEVHDLEEAVEQCRLEAFRCEIELQMAATTELPTAEELGIDGRILYSADGRAVLIAAPSEQGRKELKTTATECLPEGVDVATVLTPEVASGSPPGETAEGRATNDPETEDSVETDRNVEVPETDSRLDESKERHLRQLVDEVSSRYYSVPQGRYTWEYGYLAVRVVKGLVVLAILGWVGYHIAT